MKNPTIAIVTALLLSFATIPIAAGKPAAEEKKAPAGAAHMQRGIELARQKQFDAAIAEFTAAIEASPK
ncbi:MAG: hypothetical protein IRY93_08620, partial [Chthoniobacterales bacterium]|nr:hypothetical protein [Chthoniobacterales bacterium]